MTTKKLEFPGSSGQQLAGRLDLPPYRPNAYALFAHCFTCGKDSLAASRISRGLAERGIAVMRFDFTGLGGSGGDFGNGGFASNLEDLVAAADYLRERFDAPAILIGHSLGGAAVLAAAGNIPEVRAVATIAAPFQPKHVQHLFKDDLEDIQREGCKVVTLASGSFAVRREFLDDLDRHDPADYIARLGRALLVMHSPTDRLVGIENAASIYQAARHPKSFVSLDDADHLLTRRIDTDYCADMLATWAARYVETGTEQGLADVPQGEVLVEETGVGKFQQKVVADGHMITADEPRSVGGQETGMTPYSLLLAALGACTAMTIRMYADRKGIDVGPVSVRLRHDRIHAEDCAGRDAQEGRIDRITREIDLAGSDESLTKRILEIADMCPVHRTLTGEIEILTKPKGS